MRRARLAALPAFSVLFSAALPARAGAEDPLCRRLMPEARVMRPRYAKSDPNYINCGVGEHVSSNYVLPTHPDAPMEMHVVGVQEGSFSAGEEHARRSPSLRTVRVMVYKTRKPVLLVLSAFKPVLWQVTVTPKARLDYVILQGTAKQEVRGLPEYVSVIRRGLEESCGYLYGWEPNHNMMGANYKLAILSLRCAVGLRETSFQGCRAGAVFEVPPNRKMPPLARKGASWKASCPLNVEPLAAFQALLTVSGEPAGPPRSAGPLEEASPRRRPTEARTAEDREPVRPRAGSVDLRGTRGAERAGLEARSTRRKAEGLSRPRGAPSRKDIPVRALAILLEGNARLATHDAIPDLIEALEKGDTYLRWRAADELGNFGTKSKRAVRPLMRALKDKQARVRSSAALALGKIGPGAAPAVKLLRRALRDEHPDVRHSAETALEWIGTKSALKILRRHRRRKGLR